MAKERVGSLPWLQGLGEESRGSNGRANEGRGEATGRPGQSWKQDGERKRDTGAASVVREGWRAHEMTKNRGKMARG